jgi:NAD(P)-dependent dehydrogenase (short-subunit alcohol dehydrogenase family)
MAEGKVALVMAGGSGMGAACARHLAENGWRVGILSSSGKGEALAAALGGVGVTGSNQNEGDIARAVDAVMARWGRIDGLVNSAGHGPRAPILEISDADWLKGMEVYFLNVVRATRRVAPIMAAQGGGAIVNITTAWAFEPSAMFPTSAVARAGLAAFMKIFCDGHAARNVRMNAVAPGWIDSLPATEERRQMVPMGRYGTAAEIAATVGFLLSDGAGYITGQTLRVDGGLTRSL